MFRLILSEMLKGKSLLRVLTNQWISSITISGKGVDLGARNNKSSYFRFIKKTDDCQLQFTDLNPIGVEVIKIDLEKILPFESDSKDFLLLITVLEHLFDFQNCANESFRILKPGKRLIGCAPFLYQVHLDPDDYFRYSESSLIKIFSNAGFSNVEVTPLGFGPFSSGVSQFAGVFKFKIIVFTITYFAILVDKFLNKLFPNQNRLKPQNFPLAYGFIATK